MFKKSLLIASVFGAGAVVSGIALADSGMSSTYCKPGFYAGVQAGWGQTNYNNEDVLSEVVTNVGNYGQYYAYVPVAGAEINDTGISGRLFAGYQFNPYFAVEAGYTQFHKTDFSQTFSEVSTGSGAVSVVTPTGFSYRYDGEITEHATDVVAKVTYPFNFYGFGVYGKVGAAFVAADRHINETDITDSNGSAIPSGTFYTKSYQAVRPTYGVGLDYTIPGTSLDVDVSWTEIAGGGGIPRADLAALGASYKFA